MTFKLLFTPVCELQFSSSVHSWFFFFFCITSDFCRTNVVSPTKHPLYTEALLALHLSNLFQNFLTKENECPELWSIHPILCPKLLGGKGISHSDSCQIEIYEDAFAEIFLKAAFSSCQYLSQLPVSHHVKYFIRLEWDPNSQWGYSV